MSRLVVVSNRVAVPRDGQTAKGGLAVGLMAALETAGGLWFGWDGRVTDGNVSTPATVTRGKVKFVTMPLNRHDYDCYYSGYANRVLWPLCHERIDLMGYERRFDEAWERVNALFARKLLPRLGNDDLIWIHDFHLIPLANYLRQAGVNSPIGFFLHVPFPPYDIFRILPRHEHILRYLCAHDVVGFQTDIDQRSFVECVRSALPEAQVRGNSIRIGLWNCQTKVFPIGVDVDEIQTTARAGRASLQGRRLLESASGRRLIIGVDRLDYSKGLPQRFRAYQHLLEDYPSHRGQTILLQIAQPSRDDVPEYQQIRETLERVAGRINGRFSDYDWTPLRYLNKGFARSTVIAFLANSDVALITPLRDGMNLVAKEFVAAQDPAAPGALILSEMAGAARELDTAILVNPYDEQSMADAMARAVAMSNEERRERWEAMMKVLRRNDIHAWRRRFVDTLANTSR